MYYIIYDNISYLFHIKLYDIYFLRRCHRFDSSVGKIPWRRAWQPTPVFLPWRISWTEEPGRLQSLGSKKSYMTEVNYHVYAI